MYFVKAPRILKKLYPQNLTWKRASKDKVYLTFDDGPHASATPFVLAELQKHNAKATFFCIGQNVLALPNIYQQILHEGHKIGNHTHSHPNGWKMSSQKYIDNIKEAQAHIDSQLFRPPYGRIRSRQAKAIRKMGFEIILWDVLSGDFDTQISPQKCWENIERNIEPGSIVVFHDSSKAWERMQYALPRTLALCQKKGWEMASL
jgi:peptidoglycan/xylan/chitin deacetylase (PgdA/CDA1 family)